VSAVVLVDSGGANIGSVRHALDRLGVAAPLTADVDTIAAAQRVILPGVGAARPAMDKLRANGLDRLLPRLTRPVLGICLGMQLLFERSAEDDTECLGIVPGSVEPLRPGPGVRVPHMGWNRLEPGDRACPLAAAVGADGWAYFVHGYAAPASPVTSACFNHGGRYTAMLRHGNYFGAQFHPERSADTGARLLRAFLELRADNES